MLHFLTTANNREPIRRYLRWWGGRLRGRVRLIPYEAIDDPGRLREGAYVFGDIERLGPEGWRRRSRVPRYAGTGRIPQIFGDEGRGRLLAAHIFFDEGWTVKGTTEWPPERVAADNAFMAENPHVAAVGAIFDLAHIDFGRIDYALLDGRIQVWEINTVPTIQLRPRYYGADRLPAKEVFAGRFNAALAELDPDPRRVPVGERLRSYHDIFAKPKKARRRRANPTNGGAHIG
jgi:hypothetical protein